MKKLIALTLTGVTILSLCACNTTKTTKPVQDSDVEITDSEKPQSGNESYNYDDTYWFIDPTDEKTMKGIVDSLIACEPRLGDKSVTDVNDDLGKRVYDGFEKPYDQYSLSSYGSEFYFGYGISEKDEFVQGRDHVQSVGYSGYEKKDLNTGLLDFEIVGYSESYTHAERPGSGDVSIMVYDEARATACYKILKEYVSEIFKDEIVAVEDNGTWGYYYKYGEKANDVVAVVRCTQMKDDDGNLLDQWNIEVFITFNTPNLMEASGMVAKETHEETIGPVDDNGDPVSSEEGPSMEEVTQIITDVALDENGN